MDARLIITFSIVAFVALLLFVVLRSRGRGGRMIEQSARLPAMRSTFDGGAIAHKRISVKLGEELLQMLNEGRRDEALRLVRERTGISDVEAETAIRRYETLKERLGL
jgi:succinylarginine dihydrolase